MKQSRYILSLLILLLLATLVGKVAFLLYNQHITDFDVIDILRVLWHGLPLDTSVVAAVMVPVWLATLLTFRWPTMPLRRVAGTYLAVVTCSMALVTGAVVMMYENWKLVLDASIFSYLSSPGNATASTSMYYIFTRVGTIVLSSLVLAALSVRLTPKHCTGGNIKVFLLTGLLLATMIFGVNGRRANEHSAFHCDKIMLNHAAVNPVGHMLQSLILYAQDYDEQFENMPQQECDSLFATIWPSNTEDLTDTILTTQRPDILTLQLESMGAPFVESLGGTRGVTPELCQWMTRGVNFTSAWATSFRTDRGTVSALSGLPAYPTASLMMTDHCLPHLPSLAKTLRRYGYTADYMYGGNSAHMNKRKYLEAVGFRVWDIKDIDVDANERDIWGANDSIAMNRMLRLMVQTKAQNGADRPFYWGCQTISSHEPWDVPYRRLDNKVHNAFAYTDHCVGQFLDSLSRTPLWDNLLVIIFADHGHTYNLTLDNPEFYHIPIFMVGGAVSQRLTVSTIISQSDIVGTVLAQMGIPHSEEFPWSRNVFSNAYTYPFAYGNCPAGSIFVDSTGSTMTDLHSGYIIDDTPSANDTRVRNLQVVQQQSYATIPIP